MKKNFLLLFGLLVAGWITTNAQVNSVLDSRIQESFKKEFPDAQFVKWGSNQDYHKVDFVLMDYRLAAFFSNQGELLETRRDLSYNQLPLTVMKELEKNFPDTKFSQIEEISNNSGTKYSLRAETAKKIFKVIATPDGTISITEKTKK